LREFPQKRGQMIVEMPESCKGEKVAHQYWVQVALCALVIGVVKAVLGFWSDGGRIRENWEKEVARDGN